LPDGTPRWITSRGRAHAEADRVSSRMLGAAMDITERKRAEAALRASEARLAAGTELVGLGYYEVDYGERTCFLDDRFREICGVPSNVQSGLDPVQFWLEHVHPDDRQLLLEERQRLHRGQVDRISLEYRYLRPTTGQRWLHHSAQLATHRAGGAGIRTFGVVRDITQQRHAEMEARELRQNLTHLTRVHVLGALSGSLAHELNQPLGIILSNAQAAQELLAQEPPDLAEVQAILADIVAADRRAGEVIERLRTMLKRGQVSKQPLALNRIIEEVLRLTQADLIGRGVTVVCELASALPPIAGDRVQLQQLLLNLILNGADAMAANPPGTRRLHLQTILRQDRVRTSVRDAGGGLPAEVERLFQPFYTTKPQGLGLGLAICRSIVEAHHGRLWAETHPEQGAVFHFELPLAEGGSGQWSVLSGQ
jgi:two-component system, LuxR family, sensor kinase FixL